MKVVKYTISIAAGVLAYNIARHVGIDVMGSVVICFSSTILFRIVMDRAVH